MRDEAARSVRWLRSALPRGQSLPAEAWRLRHLALLSLLWLHAPGVIVFALLRGLSLGHAVFEGALIAAIALIATAERVVIGHRRLGASLVSIGLLTSSAVAVHLSGGAIEAHFHFFVMTSLLLLYEDWLPFLLAFFYVVVHHALLGFLDPTSIYNHPGEDARPLQWALIHGALISAAGAANVVNWRLNEDVRAESHRATDGLRRSEALLAEAQGIARLGSWEWDIDDDAVRWSVEMFRIFELEPDAFDATYEGYLERVHPEDRARLAAAVERAVTACEPFEEDHRVVTATGAVRLIAARARIVVDGTGRPVRLAGTAQDVTEQRRLEQQLRQVQKMEAVGGLAGGIAHDFNNLLTAIGGHAELALDELEGRDGSVRGSLHEIRRASDRAATLVGQLLAFSSRQMLQPRRIDLNQVIADIEPMTRRLVGEDVRFVTDLASGVAAVEADPVQIEQALVHLFANARDAMPDGGTLVISTGEVELDDEFVRSHPGALPGPHVLLAVADTGQGMDVDVRQRAFEPFFTTRERSGASGLGLSTVYGIVEQSNGCVSLESEPERGTTVTIFLPRVATPGDGRATPEPGGARAREAVTVLLAEDEHVVRELVSKLLEADGYTVLPAATGDEALALSGEHDAPIDVLLTDVVMPGMSGRALAQRIAATRPGIGVVYMSGYTDDVIDHHGVLATGAGFLQKPFTSRELAAALSDVTERRSGRAPVAVSSS